MPAATEKTWEGSPITNCDLCHLPIVKEFVDGKTVYGPWAILCPSCHRAKGVGIGTGKGQRYKARRINDEEKWVKFEG